MKNSVQLRIRMPRQEATRWLALPPSSRSKAVSLVLSAAGTCDLNELAAMRRELSSLGTLLNQSLRTSLGKSVNINALNECVSVLKHLTR
jgi:hypothetical protein